MGDVFLKFLNMSITASWLIVVVLGVRLLFRRMPKWITCVLWGVVAIRLIVPFSIESEFSLQPSAEPIKSSTIVDGEIVSYAPSIDSELSIVQEVVNPVLAQNFTCQETEGVAPLQIWKEIAGSVWIGGMIVLFVLALISIMKLHSLVREAICYKEKVYICDAVKSPFILGVINPRIYLSSSIDEQEMAYIMAHENAHLQRKDHLWKPFAYLLLCIYWFNPICWIAYIMLCKDIELACDEKVIKHMNFGDKKEYSKVLLSGATQRRLVLACPLAFGEVGVKERVQAVLKHKKPAAGITIIAVFICIIIAVCFLTNPSKKYHIRITIPAGSTERFCYSDEEISPKGASLMIENGDGLGDTEVILLPVEVREENAYEAEYMTPGMPVKKDVEEGAWYKIGVNVQNSTSEDITVYVSVRNVDIRIASEETSVAKSDEADTFKEQEKENSKIQDLAYYLELSAVDTEFQNMSEKKKKEILSEYDNLLEGYSFMARESVDGKSKYLLGYYNGDATNSSLTNIQTFEYSSGEIQKSFQILYYEDNYIELERVMDEEGVLAITEEGYAIQNSNIYWTVGGEFILIQPVDSEQNFRDLFGLYHDPARGREYIEDALSRGIALNTVKEPYLCVYMISEKYGELTEIIPLTNEEVKVILSESRKEIEEGFGFAVSMNRNGESSFYTENTGVPQSVLDMVVNKCGYQFASPSSITASIKEAQFECSWIDEPIILDKTYLPRLEEILKSAKLTGVGNCGYGAKLTLTLETGEILTVFKGMDDCGSLVFGSYGGYSISEEVDKELWEMFGLSPYAGERLNMD